MRNREKNIFSSEEIVKPSLSWKIKQRNADAEEDADTDADADVISAANNALKEMIVQIKMDISSFKIN